MKNGLNPQSEGSGRSSELPTAVFAIVDYPPGVSDIRVYSQDCPWITAEIPVEELDFYYQIDYRRQGGKLTPGSVMTFSNVPKNIVEAGIC